MSRTRRFGIFASAFGMSALLLVGCASDTGTGTEPEAEPAADAGAEPEGEPESEPAAEPEGEPEVVPPTDGGSEQCPQLSPISSPVGEACATEGQTCPSCLAPGPNCLDLVCRNGVWTQGEVAPELDGGSTPADAGATPTDAGTSPTDAGATDAGTSTADAGTSPADAG